MKHIELSNILLIASASSILLALSLAGGSLSKSVKWNLYNTETDYGTSGFAIYELYAYQNLWTSYDVHEEKNNNGKAQAYDLIRTDSWRLLPRVLVAVSIGTGGLSLAILLTFSLIPFLKKKVFVLNAARIGSSVLSVATGAILGYSLNYYKSKYPSLLSPAFHDKKSNFPDEDNVSTGFFMASAACALLFVSAIVNIVNVVLLIKKSNQKVDSVTEAELFKQQTTSGNKNGENHN